MEKPVFRFFFHPQLQNPIFIEGLPGFGNIGKIAAGMFIKSARANIFAELYSPSFPDYVTVKNDGICRTPHYEFYAASSGEKQFVILTGDTQPSHEDVVAHYALCDEILDEMERCGCRFVVTMGGVPMPHPAGEVYVAATSTKLAVQAMEKGAVIYGKGRVAGAAGLMLGLAKSRSWDGICLLGATTGLKADREAAKSVFEFLTKMLDLNEALVDPSEEKH